MDTVLQRTLSTVRAELPWSAPALVELTRAGAQVTHARHDAPRFFMRVRLPEAWTQTFDTAPEVLLVWVDGQLQGRDLAAAADEVRRSAYRLDSELIIVGDADPGTLAERLRSLPNPQLRQTVAWPSAGGRTLELSLRADLPKRDIFDFSLPVRGPRVIGRSETIDGLIRRIVLGESVAVNGLRKVGKTTVVRAATDALDPGSALPKPGRWVAQMNEGPSRALVVWTDCQTAVGGLTEVYRSVARQLSERLGGTRRSDEPNPIVQLKELLQTAYDEDARRPICVVLDEYDALFALAAETRQEDSLNRFLAMFRGFAQAWGTLSLVLIGRDPRLLDRPRLGSIPNPMLLWFGKEWLGPLGRTGADELLRRLGHRVGLEVGPESCELAWQLTGGHPRLHRVFGSTMWARRPADRWAWPTDGSVHCFRRDFLDHDDTEVLRDEVRDLLRTSYPEAAALVELANTAPRSLAAELLRRGGASAEPAKTMRRFGLLAGPPEAPWVPGFLGERRGDRRESPAVALG